jgi:hypothetical protein
MFTGFRKCKQNYRASANSISLLKTETANFRLFVANEMEDGSTQDGSMFSMVGKRYTSINDLCFSKRAHLCQ